MNPPTADGKTAGIPDRQELDGLLKLFVAFPRDTVDPGKQAKVWGDAVKDPQAVNESAEELAAGRGRLSAAGAHGFASGRRWQGYRGGKSPRRWKRFLSDAAKSGDSPRRPRPG